MNMEQQWETACDKLIEQGYEAIDNVLLPSAYDFFDLPYHSIDDDNYPICPLCGEEARIFSVQFKHKETSEEKWLSRCDDCWHILEEDEE